jgi:hypothetical protein
MIHCLGLDGGLYCNIALKISPLMSGIDGSQRSLNTVICTVTLLDVQFFAVFILKTGRIAEEEVTIIVENEEMEEKS